MKIYPIHAGYFKLDGGAMFGVVPKTLWQKNQKPDDKNLCTWAMRCMLVETGDHLILVDNGMGYKQSDKFFSYYEPHGDENLSDSLKEAGFTPEDITDVFLTHLHFDHCGGSVKWNDDKTGYELTFPNANYWCNKEHWEWATNPNAREKASFLKENILPLEEHGKLNFVEKNGQYTKNVFPGFDVLFVNGHTQAQMIPHIRYQGKTLVFAADLLPSVSHIPLPWVMAYDTQPLETLKEKKAFFREVIDNEYIIFLEHDPKNECCTLKDSEKGPRLDQTMTFSEAFPG